jgi:hypothetical protein
MVQDRASLVSVIFKHETKLAGDCLQGVCSTEKMLEEMSSGGNVQENVLDA